MENSMVPTFTDPTNKQTKKWCEGANGAESCAYKFCNVQSTIKNGQQSTRRVQLHILYFIQSLVDCRKII